MCRDIFTLFLAFLVTLFGIQPVAYGQYGAPPPQGQYGGPQPYPSQYPQAQYPQAQYPQQGPAQGQYPPAGQYPGNPQDPNAQNAGAQDPNAQGSPQQDQQHGVARISVVQGDVNLKRGDNGELVAAVTNAPVMAQDHLQTSPGSRAEIELDYGNLIRLAPNTDLGFADLEYHRYQVQLGAGTITYRVLRDANSQAEIDTPSIALRPAAQGEYRISVLDDGTTQIAVRSGQAEIFSPRGSEYVAAGHTILVRGNPADPEFQEVAPLVRDQFDDWSANRDRELESSQSYRYVSPDVEGADDLDQYGNWVPSQYGQVWAPRPPEQDWSPYSYGEWSWEPYYGWTWVDSAPWGWAPYHYGRWFYNGGYGWCWWPGARASRYLWSPALVGFFGLGAGIGVGFGALGWIALAPFELFHAWWGHGFGFGFGGYGRGGFGIRGAGLFSTYRNAGVRGGAMMANYNGFGGPHQHFSPATRSQLMNASVFRGQMPVSPSRASYQFSGRQAMANPRLASAANRQFFAHAQPAAARGSFGGARFGASQQNAVRGSYSNAARTPAGAGSGGWQRFGDPGGTAAGSRQGYTTSQEHSGWHSFGQPQQSRPSYSAARPGNAGTYGGNGSYRSPGGAGAYAAPRQSYGGGGSGGGAYGAGAYGGRSTYSAPHYSAPSPHYSAPSTPHYSAPSSSYHGGGGGAPHGGGGGGAPHGGGGGGHSSSGGHHGR